MEVLLRAVFPFRILNDKAVRPDGFVLALTYLPGPSPDKYFRHW